jgi:hypothetical protein
VEEPVPKTTNAVPESISRDDYLALIVSVGIDPNEVMSLTFKPDAIEAVVVQRDENGDMIPNARLCEPHTVLTHSIIIPVVDTIVGGDHV